MGGIDRIVLGLAVALGCGLLIGIERERRKGRGATRALAGVRTFALAALTGGIAQALAQPLLVGAGAALILTLSVVAYRGQRPREWTETGTDGAFDPGVTTELALFVTFLLGVTAIGHPSIAAGAAVVVALLLTARSELHRFSTELLSVEELQDALLLAGAALVVLPLVPDEPIAWLAGVNPRRLWSLVVVLMALQAGGYVAVRTLGARLGLAFSGLVSGFVSSTATIGAMGARARAAPALRAACVSGALFSNVATIFELAAIALAVHPPALAAITPSLVLGALAAVGAAASSLRPSGRTQPFGRTQPSGRTRPPAPPVDVERPAGHAFSTRAALLFAVLLTGVTAAASFATQRYGAVALGMLAGLAGFADAHAAAASVMSLAAGGKIPADAVLLPVLLAFTANTVSKIVVAWTMGGRAYTLRVGAGLGVLTAAVWMPWLLRA